jgi:hypothetical protein
MEPDLPVEETEKKFLTKLRVLGLLTSSLIGTVVVFVLEYFFIYQNFKDTFNHSIRFFILMLIFNFLYEFYKFKRIIREDK